MATRKRFYDLQRIMKGAGNHHRIEMLFLLRDFSAFSTEDIVQELGLNYQTGAAHVRRLVRSGLVSAYRQGQEVAHDLTPLGKKIIAFLEKL